MSEQEFSIDIDGQHLATLSPNDGASFKRLPLGDFRFRIVEVVQKAKEGDKPHVMIKPTFAVIAAHDPANAHAVGMSTDGLYAGSKQSPKFMQDRLACLTRACAITLAPGQSLSRAMFIGREFDATVTWELSKPVFDETTGAQKFYVNSRVVGERTLGTPRPATINPEIDSAEAVKYLRDKYGDGAVDAPSDTTTVADAQPAPWAPPAAQSQPAAAPAQPTYRPEAEADKTVHQYRAYVKLGQYVDQARSALTSAGFDPDGAVDVEKLDEPVKGQYLAKFPASSNGALPGMLPPIGGASGGKPATGTRARK